MIKIDESLTEEAASIHLKACKPYVETRLNFLVDLFDAVSNSNFVSFKNDAKDKKEKELRAYYGFESITSIRSLLSSIISKEIEYDDIFQVLEKGKSKVFQLDDRKISEAFDFFKDASVNIDRILKGTPIKLEGYLTPKSKEEQKHFKGLIEFIFSYEKLGKKNGEAFGHDRNWNSYALTKQLKVNVCPYCNKNWVNTVIDEDGNKVTNPQLDHFFPKDKYPLLRLSFYNLIPSCETCNSRIKGDEYLPMDDYIHPYIEGFDPEYYIAPFPKNTNSAFGIENEYTISLKEEDNSDKFKQANGSFDFFHIKDVYEKHGDIISEIYFKRAKYNLTALEDLLDHKMFKGMSLDDAYRVVFANYLKLEDYNKRPFAKLTKDTLRSLDIILDSDEI